MVSSGVSFRTHYLSGFLGSFWDPMKEVCCSSPGMDRATVLYRGDAVLQSGEARFLGDLFQEGRLASTGTEAEAGRKTRMY